MPKITQFFGLNNASDPLRLGLGWLALADNVDVTNTGSLVRRAGYERLATAALSGAFATRDGARMYVVSDTMMFRADEAGTLLPILPLTSAERMHWAEVNKQVFFNNGTDRGIFTAGGDLRPWAWDVPDVPRLTAQTGSLPAGLYMACCTFVLADGRETGAGPASIIALSDGAALGVFDVPQSPGCTTRLYIAPADSTVFQLAASACPASFTWNHSPDELGVELSSQFNNPLPNGADVIQHWRGRMYAAQYMPAQSQTVVWMSDPMAFHLFDLDSGFFLVPGRVHALAPVPDALLVGTDAEIYAYTEDAMTLLAPYGVPPGEAWAFADDDANGVLLWTKRGVCSALPFKNITQDYVSVAPGVQAGAALVRTGGEKRFVATLKAGDSAFNPRL